MPFLIETERYRLKHHVFFKEIPSGTLFDAGRSSFIIHGQSLYPLIGKIISLMDTGRSLGEIRGVLPEKLEPIFERLISALQAHQMLLEVPQASDHGVTEPEYVGQFLRFLQDHLLVTEWAPAFADWQQARALVVGHGYALKAALHALVQSAVGHISVHLAGTSEPGVPELTDVLTRHGRSEGSGYSWIEADETTWPTNCALLVHAADHLDSTLGLACERFARSHGINATIGGVWQGHGLVVPPTDGAALPLAACIEWLAGLAGAPQRGPHSPASHALMGSVVAHNALQHHFRIRSDQLADHVYLVSPWLEVSQHPLITVPYRNATPSQPGMQLPRDRLLSRYEQIRFAAERWFDPLLGPFDAVQGRHVRQLPLFHEVIRVRSARPDRLALGWGADAEEAGLRALASAFRYWAGAGSAGEEMTVAFDYQGWRAAALADAIARSEQFSLACKTVEFDPAQLVSARAQLLVKLLKLYHPRPLQVRIHWVPGLPAYQAECRSDGRVLASARAAEPIPAIEDAIGEACSRLQVLDDGIAYPPVVARHAHSLQAIESADEWLASLPCTRAELIAQMSVLEHLLPLDTLPLNTHCGRITLESPQYG